MVITSLSPDSVFVRALRSRKMCWLRLLSSAPEFGQRASNSSSLVTTRWGWKIRNVSRSKVLGLTVTAFLPRRKERWVRSTSKSWNRYLPCFLRAMSGLDGIVKPALLASLCLQSREVTKVAGVARQDNGRRLREILGGVIVGVEMRRESRSRLLCRMATPKEQGKSLALRCQPLNPLVESQRFPPPS